MAQRLSKTFLWKFFGVSDARHQLSKPLLKRTRGLALSAKEKRNSEALNTLTPREAKVIQLRYGFSGSEMTLEEVGKVFNVTRERIRQIEAKALRKLRHPSRAKRLKDYY